MQKMNTTGQVILEIFYYKKLLMLFVLAETLEHLIVYLRKCFSRPLIIKSYSFEEENIRSKIDFKKFCTLSYLL